MLAKLAVSAKLAVAEAGGAHADHGAAPAPAKAAAPLSEGDKGARVMALGLRARIAESKGDREKAIGMLREAVTVEESMRPPNGAADPIKPSHELLGEVLARAGQHASAAAAFDACLERMPNRARCLYGSASAHAAAGKRDLARERWTKLQSFWIGKPFDPPNTTRR
jgi:tetratricopeptide (TPR) repeat protein